MPLKSCKHWFHAKAATACVAVAGNGIETSWLNGALSNWHEEVQKANLAPEKSWRPVKNRKNYRF
jgi:hypothetical protein